MIQAVQPVLLDITINRAGNISRCSRDIARGISDSSLF